MADTGSCQLREATSLSRYSLSDVDWDIPSTSSTLPSTMPPPHAAAVAAAAAAAAAAASARARHKPHRK